jgi:hypothetical protein
MREDNISMDLRIEDMKMSWFIWLRIGPVGGSSEHGNETSDSINGGEILYRLSYY